MLTWNYIWPLALVLFTNIFYQVCTKSVPGDLNPFASLIITYLTGAVFAAIFYYILSPAPDLIREARNINWSPFGLGLVIVGLEVGYIYAYKIGWPVSTAATVQSAFLAIALVIVGAVFYHEGVTANKIIGVIMCIIGLYFLNR